MPMNRNNREFYDQTVTRIIEYLKKYDSLNVVEGDLIIGIKGRSMSDRTVDVLVNSVAYVDDDSFRICYSESRYDRREEFLLHGTSEAEMKIERVPDSAGSVIVGKYSEEMNPFVTPRDLIALLNMLKMTVEVVIEAPESPFKHDCEQFSVPMRILPYAEMIDTERRAALLDEYYDFGIDAIIHYLRNHKSFDFSALDFIIYVSDRNLTDFVHNSSLDIDDYFYVVRVDRVSYRDDESFLLEGSSHSIVVHRNDRRRAPCIMPSDILRIRWTTEYIMRVMGGEPLPRIDMEGGYVNRMLSHEGLRREILEEVIDTKRRVMKWHSTAAQ